MIKKIFAGFLALVALMSLAGVGLVYFQGKRDPGSNGQYVALGSSFAAGIGLGNRAPKSPMLCFRTSAGYPALLADRLGFELLELSVEHDACSENPWVLAAKPQTGTAFHPSAEGARATGNAIEKALSGHL